MQPGFADPVHDSQACFRAVLDAMARPGTIRRVEGSGVPPGLAPATAAVLLTLVDGDTPVWLDPALAAAAEWLTFHCGAPDAEARQAAFVVTNALPDLVALRAGTNEAPEDGATLVLQLEQLGAGTAFMLEGPGLSQPAPFRAGLPNGFAAYWAANRARFPLGFDLILCSGDRVAALPRSVSVREG